MAKTVREAGEHRRELVAALEDRLRFFHSRCGKTGVDLTVRLRGPGLDRVVYTLTVDHPTSEGREAISSFSGADPFHVLDEADRCVEEIRGEVDRISNREETKRHIRMIVKCVIDELSERSDL